MEIEEFDKKKGIIFLSSFSGGLIRISLTKNNWVIYNYRTNRTLKTQNKGDE